MQVQSICSECITGERKELVWLWGEFRDEGFIDVECPNGHRNRMAFQDHRYEFLFDLALVALLDGHQREAFATFMTVMERFIEFYLRVVAHERKVPTEAIDKVLRSDVSRSERETGAFAFTYLVENGRRSERHAKYAAKWSELRNGVVHRGTIPTREDAVAFGTDTFDLIVELAKEMHAKYPAGCKAALMAHVIKTHEIARKDPKPAEWPANRVWPSGGMMSPALSRAVAPEVTMTFADALEHMRTDGRKWWKP